MRASLRLSGQLPDQRSGTSVTARPEEQFGPNRPIFSRLALCMATRSRIVTSLGIVLPFLIQGFQARPEASTGAAAGVPRGVGALGRASMPVPADMTVIAIRAPGPPEVLVPEQRPLPQPGDG